MPRALDIKPDSWNVTVLPLPKRHARGKALGFCGGFPVGQAETSRATVAATWWRDGRPELLALEGFKAASAMFARGDAIPGTWRKGDGSRQGACAWRLRDGTLLGSDLHDARYERSWATAAGGGAIAGTAVPKGKLGQRAPDVGLLWREDMPPAVIADARGDVALMCTDGVRLGGSVHGRATFWPAADLPAIDLAPDKMPMSEVLAFAGELQFGVAFKGLRARAARWSLSAGSFTDLTPPEFETARIHAAADRWQVGLARVRENTRNGSSAIDDKALLWQGDANRWFDLNALLPEPYNASVAWAIEIAGDELRICGEASRVEASDPGTKQESHYVPIAHPVLWTARL